MLKHADIIAMLIKGFDLNHFADDLRTYYAVMKNVEIVGEAANMLTQAFKQAHPDTHWRSLQGMRQVLTQDYGNIVACTLFDTAVHVMPLLRKQVQNYLDETDWLAWTSVEKTTEDYIDPVATRYIRAIARKMKAKRYPPTEIANLTGLPLSVIKNLQ